MPDDGYRGSLFDASGPTGYAKALGQVSDQMTKVTSSFDALGTKSTNSLTEMGKQFDDLITKAGQFKSIVAGTAGPRGGGRGVSGGQGSGWAAPASSNAGGTGGDPGNTMNVGGDSGQAADQSSRMTRSPLGGEQDPPASPQSQSTPSRMFDPGTPSGAALAGVSYAAGAAGRWAAANQGPMMESSIQGQQFANWFGGGRGDYQTIPMVSGTAGFGGRGTEAFTQGGPADYYGAQNILAMQMGVVPQRQGQAPGQNAAMFGSALNTAMLMDPGLSRTGAAQAFSGMYTGSAIQSMAAIGIQARPGGKNTDPNQIFEQIFQKTYPSQALQGVLTQDDILNALTPGGPLEKNFEAAGLDPNSETFTLFQQYVLGRQSWSSQPGNKGKPIPQTGAAMQKAFKLDQGPAAASIKKDSRLAQAKSMVYPAASTASEHLDNAATKLLKVAEQVFGTNTSTGKSLIGQVGTALGLGGITGPAISLATTALPFLKSVPGIGGGGGPGAGINDQIVSGIGQTKTPMPTATATQAAAVSAAPTLGQVMPASQTATLTSLIATAARPTAAGTFDWYGTLAGKKTGATTPNFQLTANSALGGGNTTNGNSNSTDGSGSGDGSGGTGSSGDPNGALAGLGVGISAPTTPSGGYTPTTFAQALLSGLGAPTTDANVASLVAWMKREGGAGPQWGIKGNIDNYNPLNTTLAAPGAKSTNGPGVKSYVSWAQGLQATIDTLNSKLYSDIVAAFKAGKGLGTGHYASLLKWSGGAYDHIARGSYNIDRTKIAMLHAGERVIPAADNFSIADRYQRLSEGDGGGGTTHYHLNFQPQSVQLVAAAGTTATDMQTIAQKFVDSVSKPQIMQSVRSS